MKEVDFYPETEETAAQPEAMETRTAEAAERMPEAVTEHTPDAVGRMSGLPGSGQLLGRPGELYSDPECRHPIQGGAHYHYTYDAYGRQIFPSRGSEAGETSAEAGETAQQPEQNAAEVKETVGYASDDWSLKAGLCIARGDRAGYEQAMENYKKALEYEMSLPDLNKFHND